MGFIARILRFLFWVIVVSWSVSLLRRVVSSMGNAANDTRGPQGDSLDVPSGGTASQKLVRDPVCGMHLAPGLALAERNAGRVFYFCSEECRSKFLGEPQKFVVNG